MRNEPKKMLPELGNEWELTRVESGWRLRARPAVLTYEALRGVLAKVAGLLDGPRRVTFDLSAVEAVGAPWTPVMAVFAWLARDADVVLSGLKPQPAAIASRAFGGLQAVRVHMEP